MSPIGSRFPYLRFVFDAQAVFRVWRRGIERGLFIFIRGERIALF